MKQFFITKKDIKLVLYEWSDYKVNKVWKMFRDDYESKGKRLFDRETVPTKDFLDYAGIDKDLFIEKLMSSLNNKK